MARSFNQVILMGNLTRDPELRQTPNGQVSSTPSRRTVGSGVTAVVSSNQAQASNYWASEQPE